MTNEEMINWAGGDLDALIWVAKNQARAEVWFMVGQLAKQERDAALLSSLPSSLLPTDEDYMAALGPCGK
jgi:hypothetical protein